MKRRYFRDFAIVPMFGRYYVIHRQNSNMYLRKTGELKSACMELTSDYLYVTQEERMDQPETGWFKTKQQIVAAFRKFYNLPEDVSPIIKKSC